MPMLASKRAINIMKNAGGGVKVSGGFSWLMVTAENYSNTELLSSRSVAY